MVRRAVYYLVLLGLVCSITATQSAWAENKHARLIFSGDLPVVNASDHGDYAELASILKENEHSDNNKHRTFFFFGGGSLGPSPMSAFDRGSHIIDILNTLEPDAMSVTKREFSYYEDELSLRSFEAAFPIVASNIFDPLTQANIDGLVDRVIIEKDGLKLGIVSLINQTVISEYLLERIQVKDPLISLETTASHLRLQGADYVVLMYSNSFPFIVDSLEKGTIDLALFSDPHYELSESNQIPQHPRSVYLTQAGQYAEVHLTWDDSTKKSLEVNWQAKDLSKQIPDRQVAVQINGYTNRLNRLLNENIGTLATSIDTNRPAVRGAESAFGNLLADSLREFGGTEIGLVNGGVIRGEKIYAENTKLSRKDIAKELPFRSRVQVVNITGTKLLQALENGVSQVEDLKGKFPQISGMQITYTANAKPGNRIKTVRIAGQPIEPTQLYSLTTTDYLSSGGDGYIALADARKQQSQSKIAPLISDILINHIRRYKVVSPVKEGRIIHEDTK